MNRSQSSVLCGLGRQKVFTFLSHSHLQFINIFLPFFRFQLYQNFLLLSPQICFLTCFYPFLCNYVSWNTENPDYCSLCSHLHSGCAFPYLLKLFFCWDPCHWTSVSPVVPYCVLIPQSSFPVHLLFLSLMTVDGLLSSIFSSLYHLFKVTLLCSRVTLSALEIPDLTCLLTSCNSAHKGSLL